MPGTQQEETGLGYECHDCGEVYTPGENFAACTNDGHYVGPIQACVLPFMTPTTKD